MRSCWPSWRRKCGFKSERVKFSKRSNPPDEDARVNDRLKEIAEPFTFGQVSGPRVKVLSCGIEDMNFGDLMTELNK